ncbi:MAG: hypothetical protein AAGH68_01225 [Pseudomonadota bacterium]
MLIQVVLRWMSGVALAMLAGSSVLATELSPLQRAALEDRVAVFQDDLLTRNMRGVLEIVPRRIMQHIAQQAGVTVGQVLNSAANQAEQLMGEVRIEGFDIDVAAASAHQTPTGTGYVLLPTQLVMETKGKRIQLTSDILAIEEDSDWRLMRVSDLRQLEILRLVYPEFSGVTFGRGTMQVLE